MRNGWMVLAVMFAGCATQAPVANDDAATRAGHVGMREISGTLAEASRVTLADNESFLVPVEDDANAMPAYPDELLSKALPPQAVCMRVAIGRDGTVMSSAPAVAPPECPGGDEVDAAFFASVQRAVAGWRYDPALRCVFPDAKTKDDTVGSCGGYTEVAEAVTLTYRFVFEQRDGRGSVRMGR